MASLTLNTSISLGLGNIGAVSFRNLLFSVFAAVVNIASGVLIVAYTELKKPLKILLLNQILCDLILIIAVLIYAGHVQTKIQSDSRVCVSLVFLLTYGFVLCHASVMVISLNNFIALFVPFKHHLIFTTKKALLTIIIVWVGLAPVCMGCTGIQFSSGTVCAPLITLPQYGLLTVFTLMFVFDLGVIVINISLCIKIRRQMRVHLEPTVSTPTVQPSTSQANSGSKISSLSSSHHLLTQLQSGRPRNLNASDRASSESKVSSNLSVVSPNLSVVSPNLSVVSPNLSVSDPKLQHRGMKGHSELRNQPPLLLPQRRSFLLCHGRPELTSSRPVQPDCSLGSNSGQDFRQRIANVRDSQLRSLSVTMIIIALWCSILNVPFLTFMLYVGVAASDRTDANYGPFGVMATTCLSINALGDPFIYAWRFIKWSAILRKLQTRCQRRT